MTLRRDIKGFVAYLTEGGRHSRSTLRAYEYELNRFVDFFGDRSVEKIGEADVRMFLMRVAATSLAPAQRRALAALAAFSKWLITTKRIKEDPLKEIARPRIERKRQRSLDDIGIAKLVDGVEETAFPPRKARDLAIISLMLNAGLRLSELADLNRADVDLVAGTVNVSQSSTPRPIPLNAQLRRALVQHLSNVPDPDIEDAPLFTNAKGTRLSRDGVYFLVKRYMRGAGLLDGAQKASPHTLRRTFCVRLLDRGADVAAVKELAGLTGLGHISPNEGASSRDKLAAVNLLDQEKTRRR